MSQAKKTKVLLTGATGNMGREALRQLAEKTDQFDLVIFSLPSESDKKVLAPYQDNLDIKIVWGDLTNYDDVKKAVSGIGIVLHIAALVSPMADTRPKLAWRINFGGTKNLVDAVIELGQGETTKFVYIGSIGQYGNRPIPVHWGRVGDPLLPSAFDYYSISKVAAERYVIESGIKQWVSLRQTGIIHKDIFAVDDGISYHQPLNNSLEWITARDSGRLLYNLCTKELPSGFWNRVYNIGGGAANRLTAFEFLDKFYRMFGVDLKSLEQPNWYALRNFHGMWYLDSDDLNNYLDFRTETVDDVLAEIKRDLPLKLKLLKYIPASLVKRFFMLPRANRPNAPLYWLKHGEVAKFKAFFGSVEKWQAIPGGWDGFSLVHDEAHSKLDHGYDETKPLDQLDLADMKRAAQFRGGDCLSNKMKKGDLQTKLKWVCSEGHEFEASPYLVLKTGHWCPECFLPPWNNDKLAKKSQFIAQAWCHDHDELENEIYGEKLF